MADRLSAEAPAWLQAALFGLFTSSAVVFAVFAVSSWLLPEAAAGLTPWFALGAGLAFYGYYVVWATPRVSILRVYSEALSTVLDEPIAAAQNRVWGTGGPGWRMVGVAIVAPLVALTLPASLLFIASMSSLVSTPSDEARSVGMAFTPVGWLLVAISVGLTAAIGWLAYRMARKNETIRLLEQAVRDQEQAEALVMQAIELTHGVFPRSTASWIGGAALSCWSGGYVYGRLADVLNLGRIWETLLWMIVSTLVAMIAIRQARRAGAPVAVWTGVLAWVVAGTLLAGLVYAGAWDAFGTVLVEGHAGNWPAPNEFMMQSGIRLLANVPLILTAWATAARTVPTVAIPA